MFDLHTHTYFTDGELGPAELVQRARVAGYRGMAITDHADISNMELIITSLRRFVDRLKDDLGVKVIVGVELTHCPPPSIAMHVQEARRLGAQIVLVHGQTLVEPVEPGTNRAAIEAGTDVLAHPGLIDEDDVRRAAELGVHLEITAKRGHSLTNGHVAALATRLGAPLSFGTDGHLPDQLADESFCRSVLRGAGLDDEGARTVMDNTRRMVESRLA